MKWKLIYIQWVFPLLVCGLVILGAGKAYDLEVKFSLKESLLSILTCSQACDLNQTFTIIGQSNITLSSFWHHLRFQPIMALRVTDTKCQVLFGKPEATKSH